MPKILSIPKIIFRIYFLNFFPTIFFSSKHPLFEENSFSKPVFSSKTHLFEEISLSKPTFSSKTHLFEENFPLQGNTLLKFFHLRRIYTESAETISTKKLFLRLYSIFFRNQAKAYILSHLRSLEICFLLQLLYFCALYFAACSAIRASSEK